MRLIITISLFTLNSLFLGAQNFFNFDLEGEVNYISDLPHGWAAIPADDPICLAENGGNATPDLSDIDGLTNSISCIGNPFSGQTFVSGLLMGPASAGIFHEGIQQSVSGFKIDSTYTIYFYQTNVKQLCCANDTSGCWAIYIDDVLLEVTAPSVSYLPANSTDLSWELRQVSFTATATNHLIKFIPFDDDSDITEPDGGIRMGIDYIYIGAPPIVNIADELVMPNVFSPNNDGVNDIFAPLKIGAVQSLHTTILNSWGNIVYESDDLYILWKGIRKFDETIDEGVYFWQISGTLINNQPFKTNGFVHLIK